MIMKWFFPASMFFENKNFYGESGGDHDQFNLLSGAIIIFCNSFAVSRNIISDLQLPIKRGEFPLSLELTPQLLCSLLSPSNIRCPLRR